MEWVKHYLYNFTKKQIAKDELHGNSRTNLWKKRKAQKQLQHEAKKMRTLDEMWGVKTRDKGKDRYNELKNQLRNLQNAKKTLAKFQPYEDIQNTEYMSRCIRGWVKDFLEQGTLPSHQQGKHAKRESLLDDEDLKLVACTWLHSIPPKDHSPLSLKKELETNIFPKLLGGRWRYCGWGYCGQIYFDGHEWEDVKEYRKEWASRMMNYRKKMKQYNGDEMEIVIPPKQLEIWDTHHVLVTHDEAYFYANDDNSSFWVEDKESIIKKKGQESTIMVKREARVIIKPGQHADGYWKSKNMVKQLHEKAIPIFNAFHSGCIVKDKFKYKDDWFIHNHIKIEQPMFFLDENDGIVKFKEIKKILEERGIWTGQKLDYRRKEDDKKVPNCCTRHILTMEPDFLKQKTSIAETVEAARHIFELYPKFHCECNFIKRFWDAAKRIARQQCDYSYAQLQIRVPEILSNIPLPMIRRFS
ncbi:4912_t:CDS:10 [Cetraspora pellucida]|uniref:4912_t:CDS:1 n=1 Tax=Cetraspora pellucida TaxID=1433469 RepID=A0A9N9NMY9_9GLOM|nr:4912_t:CDS:10 [Cetraspora pellucida]